MSVRCPDCGAIAGYGHEIGHKSDCPARKRAHAIAKGILRRLTQRERPSPVDICAGGAWHGESAATNGTTSGTVPDDANRANSGNSSIEGE